jgi:hypothetical protein
MPDVLPADHVCDRCHEPRLLLAEVQLAPDRRPRLCARCWKEMGCPPPPPSTTDEVQAAEDATRRHMLARAGGDAHMVKSGRT